MESRQTWAIIEEVVVESRQTWALIEEVVVERRRGPVVGRSLWTRPARVQSPGWEARIIRCKNLALYIGDCESLVTG